MRADVAIMATLMCTAASVSAFVLPAGRPYGRNVAITDAASRTRARAVAPGIRSGLSMSSVASPPSPTSAATQDPRPSNVKVIQSSDDYMNAMAQHSDKLVVVKFYDQFCRACDEIRPRFEDMSRSVSEDVAVFYQLEFSSSKDLCKSLGIRRLPTVHIYAGPEGRIADLPAGPSRFDTIERRLAEVVASRTDVDQAAVSAE